jgi:hypothetical protein
MVEPRTVRVLSLGAGVQSTTLLLMAIHGEIEDKLDAVIFADTGWEPQAVYRHLWNLAEKAAEVDLPFYVTSAGNLRDEALDPAHCFASIPLYVKSQIGRGEGRARRQCTKEYKITPIGQTIRRKVLGLPPGRAPRNVIVEQWLGISWDEIGRMSTPRVGYMRHRYPLIDKRMTRADCITWLTEHGHQPPPKSSCIGCPMHDDRFWRALKDESPEEFADAVEFDKSIRELEPANGRRLTQDGYLHRTLIPLGEVDFRTPAQRGQGTLLGDPEDSGECDSGYCFT